MKLFSSNATLMAFTFAGLFAGSPRLLAQDDNSGFYMNTDLGVNLANNLSVSTGSISLNSGFRCDLSTGYAFQLPGEFTLGPELEVGVIYNGLNQAMSGGESTSVSGSYVQVPLLASGVLKWEPLSHLVIYGGGGAGGDVNTLNISSVGGSSADLTGDETDFAWQVTAGIRYRFSRCEAGVGYKYLAVKPSGLQTVGNSAILASFTVFF